MCYSGSTILLQCMEGTAAAARCDFPVTAVGPPGRVDDSALSRPYTRARCARSISSPLILQPRSSEACYCASHMPLAFSLGTTRQNDPCFGVAVQGLGLAGADTPLSFCSGRAAARGCSTRGLHSLRNSLTSACTVASPVPRLGLSPTSIGNIRVALPPTSPRDRRGNTGARRRQRSISSPY